MTGRFACRFVPLALAALVLVFARSEAAPASVTLGATELGADTGISTLSELDSTLWLRTPAAGRAVEAPFDGVIVRWRVRLTSVEPGDKARLRVVRRGADKVTATRSGPLVPVVNGLNELTERLPIAVGETIGFDWFVSGFETPGLFIRTAAGAGYGFTAPPLVNGVARDEGSSSNFEPLFGAEVEPDADGDGFGDETQDGCPQSAATQGPCPLVTPPQFLGGVEVRPRRLFPGGGAVFRFAVSAPASVTIAIERAAPGRRVAGECAKPTRGNRQRPACRRYVSVGALRTQAQPGDNKLSWAGRLGGRKLRPGPHRAVFAAADTAGNRATPRATSFKVLPLPRRR